MILEQIQNAVNDYENLELDYSEHSVETYDLLANASGYRIRVSGNLVVGYPVSPPVTAFASEYCRTPIVEFSKSSAARFRRYLRECTATYRTIITLTYPHGHGFDGGRAKRDLRVFLQRCRRKLGDVPGFSMCWFMEFQRRGSIHFHILCTDFIDRMFLSEVWYGICGTDDRRHLASGTNVQAIRSGRGGISSYAAKYAAKHVQKVVPPEFGWTGRFWGVCGERGVVSADIVVSVCSASDVSIMRRVEKLQNMLDDDVFHGRAKILPSKKERLVAYVIKDPDRVASYRMCVNVLGLNMISKGYYNHVFMNPEQYGEDLSAY